MPCDWSRCELAAELETAPAMREGIRARPSMKKLTVDPVPTPMTVPGGDIFERGLGGSLLLGILAHRGFAASRYNCARLRGHSRRSSESAAFFLALERRLFF